MLAAYAGVVKPKANRREKTDYRPAGISNAQPRVSRRMTKGSLSDTEFSKHRADFRRAMGRARLKNRNRLEPAVSKQ